MHDREDRIAVCVKVSINQKNRMDAGVSFHIEIHWVSDLPILGIACVTVGVEPGFLKCDNVPIIGICCIENVRLGGLGFMGILLPDSELLQECQGM